MTVATAVAEALAVRRAAREVASATAIQATFDRLASRIAGAVRDANPVLLTIMQGGAFAAVELARRFDFPCEFDYVHLSRYGEALTGGALTWRVRPDPRLQDRTVLVIDDILDQGVTLTALLDELRALGVARVLTAVLVVKELRSPQERPSVDFAGMRVGDSYVFGCGMDYKGYWRGLPALYAVAGNG